VSAHAKNVNSRRGERPRTAHPPGRTGLRYLRIAPPGEIQGPVPLVLGVTGHRDLAGSQLQALEARVARVIAEARSECRYTPLVLLTALAEGADRLAARVALREKVRVVATLPLPPEEYERDFATPGSVEEFRALLGSASIVQVPESEPDDRSEGWRTRRYADAGAYIVANCDLLIALWDGNPHAPPGGTASVVGWQCNGLPSTYTRARGPLDPAGSGPVRHILAARAGTEPAGAVTDHLLEPGCRARPVPDGFDPGEPDARGEICPAPYLGTIEWPIREQIHGFNRDAVYLKDRVAAREAEARGDLEKAYARPLPRSAEATLQTLARSDALARYFRDRRMSAIRWTFAWAGLAIVLFTLFAHPLHSYLALLAGYLACFALALGYAWRARRLRLEEKHLDYRALAEGLRVQLFWTLAGITDPVTEYYLRNQRTELAWIPRALRALCVQWGFSGAGGGAGDRDALVAVEKAWVQAEIGFFEHRIQGLERAEEWCERGSRLFFTLALAGAGVLLLMKLREHGGLAALFHTLPHAEEGSQGFAWLIAGLALLALVAGFCRAIAEKMGFSAEHRRYEWMRRLHVQVETAFEAGAHPDDMRDLLVDLGRYALIENAEWLRIHRDHPLEVPVGG
jgi:hypothetical protein